MLGSDVMVQRFGRAGQDAIFALEFLDPDAMSATDEPRSPTIHGAAVSARHGVSDGATSRRTRPAPYDEVQRQLTASAAVDGLIRVVGRPGSGKRYQASKWLRQRTGQEPKVFAARDLPADDGVWGDGEAAMRDGRGIIVVGGEKLSSESRERLDDFARLPRPGVGPDAPGHPHRTHPDGQPRVRGRRRAGFGTRALPRRPARRAARRRARGRMPSFSPTRRRHASRRLRCNACWPGRGRETWPS